jgi:hypothetical protein
LFGGGIAPRRHCEEATPTTQSSLRLHQIQTGLLRGACARTARSADPGARNDEDYELGGNNA